MSKPQVSTDHLSRAELSAYEGMKRDAGAAAREEGAGPLGPVAWGVLGVAALVVVGALVAAVVSGGSSIVVPLAVVTIFCVFCAVVTGFSLREALGQDRVLRRKLREADQYVEALRNRPAATSTNGGYDDGDWVSTRQRQHQWYGGHSELNWRDRETAEMFGMDADTYVSNWKEHDPS